MSEPGVAVPGEESAKERQELLRRAVVQAFALLPDAPGAGEGPTPKQIDAVVELVLGLYDITAERRSLADWLGLAFGVDPAEAELGAARAVRDVILALRTDGGPATGDDDERADIADANRAAELFGTIEVPDEEQQ